MFKAAGEPTLYWTGDTIWYEPVQQVIREHQPEVIVTHSSGAVWGDDPNPIVMDAAQTLAVCQFAPQAAVVAVHLESLDHGQVSRADLQAVSVPQLRIPLDGETLEF